MPLPPPFSKDKAQNYDAVSNQKFETARGVPVAVLDDVYGRETVVLAEQIKKYVSMVSKEKVVSSLDGLQEVGGG